MVTTVSRLIGVALAAIATLAGPPHTALVASSPADIPSITQTAAQTGIITAIFSGLPPQAAHPLVATDTALGTSTSLKTATSSATTSIPHFPVVVIKPPAPTSTATALTAASTKKTATSTSTPASAPKVAPTPKAAPAPKTPLAPALSITTAAALVANVTTSLATRLGGQYTIVFKINSGGQTILSWNYGDTPIGGANGIAQFSASYNCNPPPTPLLTIRTDYDCTADFTPLSGADQRTQTDHITFSTGPGAFFALPPSTMNTHLVNDENDGGFAFTNQDTKPITITSLTFDISFAGLTTAYGPLVLRLVDPKDPTNHIDYHLEGTPAVPGKDFTYSVTGVNIPFPFTVDGSNQKLLPIEILGVHKMSVSGLDPTVTITLRSVTTDRSDVKMQINSPHISWSCVVTLAPYDPNATSGPYASGEACLQ